MFRRRHLRPAPPRFQNGTFASTARLHERQVTKNVYRVRSGENNNVALLLTAAVAQMMTLGNDFIRTQAARATDGSKTCSPPTLVTDVAVRHSIEGGFEHASASKA